MFNKSKNLNPEDRQNFVGFFELLLKIDMRNNPEKYKQKEATKPLKTSLKE